MPLICWPVWRYRHLQTPQPEPHQLENIFHRLFGAAQLDLTIEDRFGNPVKPKEWFLVPLHVIDEAVQRIRDGSITEVAYDPKTALLVG